MHFIQYNEQQIPITIDFAVIKVVCGKLSLKITDFELIINNPANTEVLCFEALKRGHKLEGQELLIKEADVEEVLSQSYGDFIKVFNESILKMFSASKKN